MSWQNHQKFRKPCNVVNRVISYEMGSSLIRERRRATRWRRGPILASIWMQEGVPLRPVASRSPLPHTGRSRDAASARTTVTRNDTREFLDVTVIKVLQWLSNTPVSQPLYFHQSYRHSRICTNLDFPSNSTFLQKSTIIKDLTYKYENICSSKKK